MRRRIALTALAALTGCASPAQQAAQLQANEQATCMRYGFKPDTQQFAQCMMQVDQSYQARRAALIGAYLRSQPVYRAPAYRPPVTTTCTGYGATATCTSY